VLQLGDHAPIVVADPLGSAALSRGDVISNSFPLRYGAYTAALARIVRYAAYTSDVGEAFRPVVHRRVVQAAYGVSWAYVVGDCAYDHYHMTHNGVSGADLWAMTAKRVVFQSVASMALPAFTIHTVVHETKKHIFAKHFPRYLRWGPTTCGLAVVPFLPFMWDAPCEYVLDKAFDACYTTTDPWLKQQQAQQHHQH